MLGWLDTLPRLFTDARSYLTAVRRYAESLAGRLTAGNDDILEPEAVALADTGDPDAELGWLHTRPGMTTDRQKWLLRLLTSRIAEQYGRTYLTLHLFTELGDRARVATRTDWEPEQLFGLQTRHLKLLRLKAICSEVYMARLTPLITNNLPC